MKSKPLAGVSIHLILIGIILSGLLILKSIAFFQVTCLQASSAVLSGGDFFSPQVRSRKYETALALKRILPEGACITTSFSSTDVTLESISFKYYLYPYKVIDNWPSLFNKTARICNGNFFVDFTYLRPISPPNSSVIQLSSGVRVSALDSGSHFVENPRKIGNPYAPLYFLFLQIVVFLGGYGFICFFRALKNTKSIFVKISASYLLGVIIFTGIIWLLLLFKLPLSMMAVCSLVGIYIFLLFSILRQKNKPLSFVLNVNKKSPNSIYLRDKICRHLGIVVIAIVICLFLIRVVSLPVVVWDEMHIWLLKAKMFYTENGLAFDYTVDSNNYYPVLWPLFLAAQYALNGGIDDRIAKWTSALVFLSFLGVWWDILRGYIGGIKVPSLLIVIFLMCFPHWTYFTALTENFYIALMALSFYFLSHYFIKDDRTAFIPAMIAMAGVASVKFEGGVLCFFLLSALILSKDLNVTRSPSLLIKCTPFIFPILIPFIWKGWVVANHLPVLVYHIQNTPSFSNLLAAAQIGFLFLISRGIDLVFIILALAISLTQGKHFRPWAWEDKFLLFFCCWLLIFTFSAGLCWPMNELVLYYPEVLTRLFSRTVPFLLILWAVRTFGSIPAHNLVDLSVNEGK